LNAVFVADKRDAGLFVFGDVRVPQSQQQQSSEMNHRQVNF
jgi:hypothetical protein